MTDSYFSLDTVEFMRLLASHGVRYLLVGGQAVIRHGYPRYTKDVDLFYDRETRNTERLWRALVEFWEGDVPGIDSVLELQEPNVFLLFGAPPHRIDLISTLGTVRFADAWERRLEEVIAEAPPLVLPIIGLQDLIQSKLDAGRLQDLADVERLTGRSPLDR